MWLCSNSIPVTCSPWFLYLLFGRKIFLRSWDIWFSVYLIIHFEICDVTISTRDHKFAIYLRIQLLLSNESYCSFLWMGGSQNWTFFVYVINVCPLSNRLECISENIFWYFNQLTIHSIVRKCIGWCGNSCN